MATWKKVIVSGSAAALESVSLDSAVQVSSNQIVSVTPASTRLSGSFSGSFQGDGSQLTGIPSVLNFTDYLGSSDSLNLLSDTLLFTTGSDYGLGVAVTNNTVTLGLPQDLRTTAEPRFAGLEAGAINIAAGANNTEIDTDSGNLILDSAGGTVEVDDNLNVAGNTTIAGNLYVNGTLTNINTANLDIEDAFVLLRSGSAVVGDSGIIFGGSTGIEQAGSVLYFDASYALNEGRLAFKGSVGSTVTGSLTADYYIPGVVIGNETAATTAEANHAGNMRIDGGEIYIYV